MNKSETVFTLVKSIYETDSTSDIGRWMWTNHVQWVADKSISLAKKYGAEQEKVYCAALLHDLADCSYERSHVDFDTWSEKSGAEILQEAGFSETEVKEIIEVIIRPHSCRPDNLPTTLEGKVLATADAMFHLQTSFFPLLCHKNQPGFTRNYRDWQDWFDEAVDRNFNVKIFFEEERQEVKDDFRSLSKVFGNRGLSDL